MRLRRNSAHLLCGTYPRNRAKSSDSKVMTEEAYTGEKKSKNLSDDGN